MASSIPGSSILGSSYSAPSILSHETNSGVDEEKKEIKNEGKGREVPLLKLGVVPDSTWYGTTPRQGDGVALKLYTYDRFKSDISENKVILRIYYKRFPQSIEQDILSPRGEESFGVVKKIVEHFHSKECVQKNLSLIGCELEPVIFKSLCEGIFSSKNITTFQIENTKNINLEVFKTLEKVMAFGHCYIKTLKFVSVEISPIAFHHIVQGIIAQNQHEEKYAITELCFEDCNLDNLPEPQEIDESQQPSAGKTELQPPHYAEFLYSLILHSKHLRKLNLQGNHLGSNKVVAKQQTPRTPKSPRTPGRESPRQVTPRTIRSIQIVNPPSPSVDIKSPITPRGTQNSPKISYSPRISTIKHQVLSQQSNPEAKRIVSKAVRAITEAWKVNRSLQSLMLCSNKISLGDYQEFYDLILERRLTDAIKEKQLEDGAIVKAVGAFVSAKRGRIRINLWGNSLQDQRDAEELVTKGYSPRSEASPPTDEGVSHKKSRKEAKEAPPRLGESPREEDSKDSIQETPRNKGLLSTRVRSISMHSMMQAKK